jgi:MYXO-CTERM domain-containing protein
MHATEAGTDAAAAHDGAREGGASDVATGDASEGDGGEIVEGDGGADGGRNHGAALGGCSVSHPRGHRSDLAWWMVGVAAVFAARRRREGTSYRSSRRLAS